MLKSYVFQGLASFAIVLLIAWQFWPQAPKIVPGEPAYITHLKTCPRCLVMDGETADRYEPATSCPDMQRIRLAAGFPIRPGTAQPAAEPVAIPEPIIAAW